MFLDKRPSKKKTFAVAEVTLWAWLWFICLFIFDDTIDWQEHSNSVWSRSTGVVPAQACKGRWWPKTVSLHIKGQRVSEFMRSQCRFSVLQLFPVDTWADQLGLLQNPRNAETEMDQQSKSTSTSSATSCSHVLDCIYYCGTHWIYLKDDIPLQFGDLMSLRTDLLVYFLVYFSALNINT